MIIQAKNNENIFEILQISDLLEECGLKYLVVSEDEFRTENFTLKEERLYYNDKEVAVLYFRYFYN